MSKETNIQDRLRVYEDLSYEDDPNSFVQLTDADMVDPGATILKLKEQVVRLGRVVEGQQSAMYTVAHVRRVEAENERLQKEVKASRRDRTPRWRRLYLDLAETLVDTAQTLGEEAEAAISLAKHHSSPEEA